MAKLKFRPNPLRRRRDGYDTDRVFYVLGLRLEVWHYKYSEMEFWVRRNRPEKAIVICAGYAEISISLAR